MKTQNQVLAMIIILLASGMFTSCQKKWSVEEEQSQQNMSFVELTVPNDFNWQLSRTVSFVVKSSKEKLLKISSVNGDIVYYKAMLAGGNNAHTAKVELPNHVREIIINGILTNLNGSSISINLNNLKSTHSVNHSIEFDGSTHYAKIMGIPALNLSQHFTFSGWINHANPKENDCYIMNRTKPGTGAFQILTSGGQMHIYLHGNKKALARWSKYSTVIAADSWYHLAVVFDGTKKKNADRLKLYINGNQIALTFSGNIPDRYPKLAGAIHYISTPKKFDGNIDEWRLWSISRKQSDIQNDMYTTISGGETGLLAYYRMDEILGNKTPEYSGSNVNFYLEKNPTLSTDVPFSYIADQDGDGVPDDQDDFPTDPDRAFKNFVPAAGYGSLAFEDLWPGKGDYDFNDVVVDYQFQVNTNADNYITEIYGTFVSKASGAFLQNGFGFDLFEAAPVNHLQGKLAVSGMDLQENIVTLRNSGVEDGQDKLTFVVFDNIFNRLEKSGTGLGVNTETGQVQVAYDTIKLTITTLSNFTANNIALHSFNPFIIVDRARDHEVHLLDFPPTSLMNETMFATYEDASNISASEYYKTRNNLPWALKLPAEFNWPREKVDITRAYYHFAEWAESGGTVFDDWYMDKAGYRDETLIY